MDGGGGGGGGGVILVPRVSVHALACITST